MFIPKISKEEVNNMPVVAFEGEITVVDDPETAHLALADLQRHKVVGIDTETKPSFTKGIHHKVALLQISTADHCYLFRLNKFPFPEELGEFLASKSIKKIGLALKDDFVGLNRYVRFKPANVVDIQNIIKSYGIFEMGLQKIYAILFGQKISKSQRLTNWENPELTQQQSRYAATDAWAVLKIYSELSKAQKLTKKEIEVLAAKLAEDENKLTKPAASQAES